MWTPSRFLIDLHFRNLQLWFSGFSMVIVSLSGGKGSALALFYAIELFGTENLATHHQIIPEDYAATIEHCQFLCDFFGIS